VHSGATALDTERQTGAKRSETKKPPEGGFVRLLAAHPLQTANGTCRSGCLPEVNQAENEF
jgi:hypothetical protein